MFLFITALIFIFISKLRFPKKVSIATTLKSISDERFYFCRGVQLSPIASGGSLSIGDSLADKDTPHHMGPDSPSVGGTKSTSSQTPSGRKRSPSLTLPILTHSPNGHVGGSPFLTPQFGGRGAHMGNGEVSQEGCQVLLALSETRRGLAESFQERKDNLKTLLSDSSVVL